MSRTDKSIKTESRLVVARGWGERGIETGVKVPFWVKGNILELDSEMVAQCFRD
jgi:hypothetical protein